MNDDEIYESIIKEIKERRLDHAVYAKAMVESDGNEATVIARYIRLRCEQLQMIRGTSRVALWNPLVAAQWSVAFTPLFGAYIHMRNWQAMGEDQRASQSRRWILTGLAVQLLILLLAIYIPFTQTLVFFVLGAATVIGFLGSWYFYSARKQAQYVAANFGQSYKHNSWTEVIFIAFSIWLAFLFALTGIIVSKFNTEADAAYPPIVSENQYQVENKEMSIKAVSKQE